jgi:hypothetical protein
VTGVVLGEEQIRNILSEAQSALREYVTADGQAAFDARAHIVTGNGPAATVGAD